MKRLNVDVGAFDGPFQETPDIFDAVGMEFPINILLSMVNDAMNISVAEIVVRLQGVGAVPQARIAPLPTCCPRGLVIRITASWRVW